jgi:2-dehydropantoate 2-reductase
MVDTLIYGSGAIGSFLGYLLSEPIRNKSDQIENVALLGRKSHIQEIEKNGLKIRLSNGCNTLKFKHCFDGIDQLLQSNFFPEIVIICVKTYSLRQVVDEIIESNILNRNFKQSNFILLMNGMGNIENFNIPSENIFEGITSIGVNFPNDGFIELKGVGKTFIDHRIDNRFKRFFTERVVEKGFEIEFPEEFKNHQWNKLFINSVINPITALTKGHNGIILSKNLENTVKMLVEECVNVASKEGILADKEKVFDLVYSVAEKTSMNTSSMLQDVLKGRLTEIESINGYIVSLAKKHKIKVQANEALYGLVKSIEDKDKANHN